MGISMLLWVKCLMLSFVFGIFLSVEMRPNQPQNKHALIHVNYHPVWKNKC